MEDHKSFWEPLNRIIFMSKRNYTKIISRILEQITGITGLGVGKETFVVASSTLKYISL